jgi:hypothetical protein
VGDGDRFLWGSPRPCRITLEGDTIGGSLGEISGGRFVVI